MLDKILILALALALAIVLLAGCTSIQAYIPDVCQQGVPTIDIFRPILVKNTAKTLS
jgi:outer membrane protein assembly factor BamE (lipoprotein component of BamABCDE complex)